MFMISLIDKNDFGSIKRMAYIIIVFTVIGFALERFLRRVAYKIVIDFNRNTIEFYMCRSDKTKKYDFHLIKVISIKTYAKFVFEDEKIFYAVGKNENFNRSIDKLNVEFVGHP